MKDEAPINSSSNEQFEPESLELAIHKILSRKLQGINNHVILDLAVIELAQEFLVVLNTQVTSITYRLEIEDEEKQQTP